MARPYRRYNASASREGSQKTKAEATVRAKCNRVRKKHLGIKGQKRSGFQSNFKRKINGDVIDTRTGEIVSR